MDMSTALTIAGAVLLIAAIIGGSFEIKEIKLPHMSVPIRILSAACGLAFLAGAYAVNTTGIQPSRDDTFSVMITSPASGSTIALNETIKGLARPPVPNGGSYWVVVMDDDGDHYPLVQLNPLPDGNWSYELDLGNVWSGRAADLSIVYMPEASTAMLVDMADDGTEALSPFPSGAQRLVTQRYKVE